MALGGPPESLSVASDVNGSALGGDIEHTDCRTVGADQVRARGDECWRGHGPCDAARVRDYSATLVGASLVFLGAAPRWIGFPRTNPNTVTVAVTEPVDACRR
jgi:hypothetical protein